MLRSSAALPHGLMLLAVFSSPESPVHNPVLSRVFPNAPLRTRHLSAAQPSVPALLSILRPAPYITCEDFSLPTAVRKKTPFGFAPS